MEQSLASEALPLSQTTECSLHVCTCLTRTDSCCVLHASTSIIYQSPDLVFWILSGVQLWNEVMRWILSRWCFAEYRQLHVFSFVKHIHFWVLAKSVFVRSQWLLLQFVSSCLPPLLLLFHGGWRTALRCLSPLTCVWDANDEVMFKILQNVLIRFLGGSYGVLSLFHYQFTLHGMSASVRVGRVATHKPSAFFIPVSSTYSGEYKQLSHINHSPGRQHVTH